MHWYQKNLSGSAGTHRALCQICRPERVADVPKYMEQVGKNGVIVRGTGSAYADQTLNNGGAVMISDRLDQIRSFDEETGELICEPGLTLEKITELFAPRGFMFPIACGSGRRTLGGAIAAGFFGMNTPKRQSLGNALNWMDVVLSNGQTVHASSDQNADLFSAVLGGQGLIGVITLVSLTLPKRPEENVRVVNKRYPNVDALFEALRSARKTADFAVAWIDTSAKGENIGRSVLKTAAFTSQAERKPFISKYDFKASAPRFFLNIAALPFVKEMRYRLTPAESDVIVPYEKFLYPSDRYGVVSSKNVYQLRIAFPEAEGPQAVRQILTELSASGVHACRAVLQLIKDEPVADLAFPMYGYCLSLDFVHRRRLDEFLKHLAMVALEFKGRLALCNDALLDRRLLFRMYPNVEKFITTRKKFDPQFKFDSDFARRVFKERDDG